MMYFLGLSVIVQGHRDLGEHVKEPERKEWVMANSSFLCVQFIIGQWRSGLLGILPQLVMTPKSCQVADQSTATKPGNAWGTLSYKFQAGPREHI